MLYTSFRNWNVIFATIILWTGIVAEECPSACGCFTYEYEFRIYCPENYFQVLVALGKKNDIYTDISINCISPKSDNDYCLISTILNKILIKTNIKNLTKLSFESRPQNRTDIIVSKDTFKSVPNLAALFISYNSIVTFESDFLRNIPNIIRLGLTKSGISKIHNFFSYSMMKVQYLSLRQNKINSLPDKAFENLPALMHLFLTSNNISSVSTDAFSGLRRLQMLDLSYNKIRELTEDHFKDLSKLGHINLESNRLINIDGNIFNKTPLMIVDLRNNSEIVLPDYLLANLTLLSTVDLSLNNLQEIPRNIFRKCERLSWLSLSENRLSTLSETLFKNLYKLRTLDISENKLKALPNRLFASTPMLSKLNLSNNQLSVINEYLFSALANLYRLDLHSNKIYLIEFDAFKWQHQSLTYIDLSHNKWNPTGANNSLSYCQRLEELNLSHNKIREFPFMPALIYLKKMDLSYNLIDYFEVKYVFPSLLTPTKYDLSHNRIRNITFCLDMPIGPKLLGSTKTLLNITENPIQCDCSIYDLVRFNNGEMKDLSEVLNIIQNNLYCTGKHNNTLIQTLKPIDFECSVLPGCPSTCKCYVTPCNKRLVIDCAFKNLTIYPEIYVKEPSHQQIILNLSGNLLTEGPFEQDSYSKVTSLNLSSNRIHAMEWIPPQTKELDLSNNSLKNLNSAFIKRLKNATSLQWLGLINNPWICDCEALDLKDYLIENYNQAFVLYPHISTGHSVSSPAITRFQPKEWQICQSDQILQGYKVGYQKCMFNLWAHPPFCQVKSDNSCDIEISETLRTLLNPQESDSIQVQALRRQLLRKLQEDLDLAELEDEKNYKRNLASLAAWNNLPDEHKRNLEALARAGTWYKNPPELDQNDDANYKRSIANLAKNGQTPLMPLPLENQKRGIEALARNGDLHRRQNYQTLLNSADFKRNVQSLARAYNFPVGNTAGFGKRSIGSLARNGDLPYAPGKRNIQSLARDGALGKRSADYVDVTQDKRSIQSIKAQQRSKRQADYFDNEMVYQMPPDYEDILQELATAQDVYPAEDKRFLGRIPQMGKTKTTAIPKSRRYQ